MEKMLESPSHLIDPEEEVKMTDPRGVTITSQLKSTSSSRHHYKLTQIVVTKKKKINKRRETFESLVDVLPVGSLGLT